MPFRLYCKACLLKNQELSVLYVSTIQDGKDVLACPTCKVDKAVGVPVVKLLEILWAAAGHTPDQRTLLQEYMKLMLEEG